MALHSEMALSNGGKFSWIEPMEHLIDLAQVNRLETYDNKIVIKNKVKELQKQYKDVIMQYLNDIKSEKEGGKLCTYSLLKDNHEMEPYLKSNMPRHYRCKITAFREDHMIMKLNVDDIVPLKYQQNVDNANFV